MSDHPLAVCGAAYLRRLSYKAVAIAEHVRRFPGLDFRDACDYLMALLRARQGGTCLDNELS